MTRKQAITTARRRFLETHTPQIVYRDLDGEYHVTTMQTYHQSHDIYEERVIASFE